MKESYNLSIFIAFSLTAVPWTRQVKYNIQPKGIDFQPPFYEDL